MKRGGDCKSSSANFGEPIIKKGRSRELEEKVTRRKKAPGARTFPLASVAAAAVPAAAAAASVRNETGLQ